MARCPPPLFGFATLSILCLVFFVVSVIVSVVEVRRAYATDPAEDWVLVGGLTTESARFRIRSDRNGLVLDVTGAESLPLSTPIDENLTSSMYATELTGLEPNTRYDYQLVSEETILWQGSFSTPPPSQENSSFRVVAAGCAWTGSKHAVFEKMSEKDPLLFLQLGDLHYEDIGTNDLQKRLDAIGKVMASPSQSRLLASTSMAYMWDDHDWLGNDSGAGFSTPGARDTALLSYGLAIPHYPLPAATTPNTLEAVSPYQAFTLGKVRFILSDVRSESTTTSIYSVTQKEWFHQELEKAANDDNVNMVVWVTTKPWIGEPEVGEDNWLGHPEERAELSERVSALFGAKQHFLAVSSDAHMVAFDDGSNTYYGNDTLALSFPILQTGPLDRLGSVKGGPFREGCTTTKNDRNHQYTLLSFNDDNTCVEVTAYRVGGSEEVLWQRRLCAPFFVEPAPQGSCEASFLNSSSYVLLGVAAGIWVLLTIALCFLGVRRAALGVSFLVLVGYLATVFVNVGIPVTIGIPQFDTFTALLIGLVQTIVVTIYCGNWYYYTRDKHDEKPIYDAEESMNDEEVSGNEVESSVY